MQLVELICHDFRENKQKRYTPKTHYATIHQHLTPPIEIINDCSLGNNI